MEIKIKRVVIVLVFLLLANPAFAENTDLATWDHHWMDDWERYKFDHHHSFEIPEDNREDALGLGANIVVYENPGFDLLQEVTVDTRFDLENDEQSVFVVGRVNLFRLTKKWLGKHPM